MMNLSDGGFLLAPSSFYRKLNTDVVTFDEMASLHALGCLGEPGMGKSEEFAGLQKLADSASSPGSRVLSVDLERYRDKQFLMDNILNTAEYQAWRTDESRLYVFFDNLDRLSLAPHLFAQDLFECLQDSPLERLFVRFACRTFDWPSTLEYKLEALFSGRVRESTSVGVFELAPLTRSDVQDAAKAEGVDEAKFLDAVERADIVAFAIKPVTLRFLINKYKNQSRLPSSMSDLYREGCMLLCEEPNPELHEARKAGKFPAKYRFAAACRVAAVMMFCQKSAIWSGVDEGTIPEGDIKLDELVGGVEAIDGVEIEITKELLEETLASGLFNSRGEHRFGLAHQTYAEFLAALYLTERHTTKSQVLSLLVHPTDPAGKVVPQLAATAAWLAIHYPEILGYMIVHDPEALLLSDLDKVGGEDRESLVKELLQAVERTQLPMRSIRQRYQKLNHGGLGKQLQTVLLDGTKSFMARYEAVQIAQACELRELVPDLITLATDPTGNVELRSLAAIAIHDLGGADGLKEKLLPLAQGVSGDDPNDEMKGAALYALFPNHITATELFGLITPHKNESLLGSYDFFLNYQLFERFKPGDYVVALKWVQAQDPTSMKRQGRLFKMESFCDNVMWQAWHQLDDSEVLKIFAEVSFARLSEYDSIVGGIHSNEFNAELSTNSQRRQALVKELVKLGLASNQETRELGFALRSVVSSDDLDWLVGWLQTETDPPTRAVIIELTRNSYRFARIDHLETLDNARRQHSDLNDAFAWLFEVFALGSDRAKEERERFERYNTSVGESEKPVEPPPAERVRIRLEQSEKGSPQSWSDLHRQLSLHHDATSRTKYSDDADVTGYPGWTNAEEALRNRIVDAAERFLTDKNIEPKIDECLKGTGITNYLLDGVRALFLLKSAAPQRFEALSHDVWKKWMGAILLFPSSFGESAQLALLKDAYRQAPDELLAVFVNRLRFEATVWQHIPVVSLFSELMDPRIAAILIEELKNDDISEEGKKSIVRTLARSNSTEFVSWAFDSITTNAHSRAGDKVLVCAAANMIANHSDVVWDKFWGIVETDPDFGKAVFAELGHLSFSSPFLNQLTDVQLAVLFIWLWEQFPEPQSEQREMVAEWTAGDAIFDLRTHIPNILSKRNTQGACDALKRLVDRFPDFVGLRRMMLDAQERLRTENWIPYAPRYILQLVNNRKARLVANESELLDCIVAVLAELQTDLQSHQAMNEDFWRDVPISFVKKLTGWLSGKKHEKFYLPRDEEAFCNVVARYLQKQLASSGVIVNREIVIRPNPGAKGERTDIHVDAVALAGDKTAYERITVVIEAKGIWNDELETAMQTQLRDQYLNQARSKSGIFLVGYFNCPQWDSNDYRYANSKGRTLDGTRQLLEGQAADLSKDGFRIEAVVLDVSLRDNS
jgi:hypothetical protein